MKSLERIGEFIESRRRNREVLKLQQERCEAWEQIPPGHGSDT